MKFCKSQSKRCESRKGLCQPGEHTALTEDQLCRNPRPRLARSSHGFKQSQAPDFYMKFPDSWILTTHWKKKFLTPYYSSKNMTRGLIGLAVCCLGPDLSPWNNRPDDPPRGLSSLNSARHMVAERPWRNRTTISNMGFQGVKWLTSSFGK